MPRICIIGNAGSGKSTLAKALGAQLNIPVHHLDRHLLNANFQKLAPQDYLKTHTELIQEDNWIIDGQYELALPDRLKRATLVIFLDVSRFVTLPRIIRRTRGDGHESDTIPEGAKNKQLDWSFLHWAMHYSRQYWKSTLQKECTKLSVPLLVLRSGSLESLVEHVKEVLI